MSQCKEDWKWHPRERRSYLITFVSMQRGLKGCSISYAIESIFSRLNAKRIERSLGSYPCIEILSCLNAKRIERNDSIRKTDLDSHRSQCKEDWKKGEIQGWGLSWKCVSMQRGLKDIGMMHFPTLIEGTVSMQRGLKVPERTWNSLSRGDVSMQRGLKEQMREGLTDQMLCCLNAKRIERLTLDFHFSRLSLSCLNAKRIERAITALSHVCKARTRLNAKRIESYPCPRCSVYRSCCVSMQRGLKDYFHNPLAHSGITPVSMQRGLKVHTICTWKPSRDRSQCKEDWKISQQIFMKSWNRCLNAKRIERWYILCLLWMKNLRLNAKRIESSDTWVVVFFSFSKSQCKEDWKPKYVRLGNGNEGESQCKEDWKCCSMFFCRHPRWGLNAKRIESFWALNHSKEARLLSLNAKRIERPS